MGTTKDLEVQELGRVTKTHDSGMSDTSEGHRVSIKGAVKGDRICMVKGGKPYIEDGKLTPAYEHDGKTVEELENDLNKTQMKAILKQMNKEGYSSLEKHDLAVYIFTGEKPTIEGGE